jgi:hypothetical protein
MWVERACVDVQTIDQFRFSECLGILFAPKGFGLPDESALAG